MATKKTEAKKPDKLREWQDEVEEVFARNLNILVGSKREAAEETEEEEGEAA